MKLLRILLLYLFVSAQIVSAQKKIILYLDEKGYVLPSKRGYEYYRVIEFDSQHKIIPVIHDYYPGGELYHEAAESYTDTINIFRDTVDGFSRYYSLKGRLIKESFYKKGKLDGEQRTWYEDGIFCSKGSYINGYPDGEFLTYYNNTNLKYRIHYSKGAIVGKTSDYYDAFAIHANYFYDEFRFPDNFYEFKMTTGKWMDCIHPDTGLSVGGSKKKDVFVYGEFPFDASNRFIYDINISKEYGDDDAGYGLIYNYCDESNYSYFLIRSDGYFSTGTKEGGVEKDSATWKPTKKISVNGKSDYLRLERSGSFFNFYINGKKVETRVFTKIENLNYGIMCRRGEIGVLWRAMYFYGY